MSGPSRKEGVVTEMQVSSVMGVVQEVLVPPAAAGAEAAEGDAVAVVADKCAKSVDLVCVAEHEDARFQVASWTTLESSKRGVLVV